jgi:hypothetical protein
MGECNDLYHIPTYNNGKERRRRERCETLPVDILGQDCPENGLPWLMGSDSFFDCFRADCRLLV